MSQPLLQEKVWFQKAKYDEAEKNYYEKLAKLQHGGRNKNGSVKRSSKKGNNKNKIQQPVTETPPPAAEAPPIPVPVPLAIPEEEAKVLFPPTEVPVPPEPEAVEEEEVVANIPTKEEPCIVEGARNGKKPEINPWPVVDPQPRLERLESEEYPALPQAAPSQEAPKPQAPSVPLEAPKPQTPSVPLEAPKPPKNEKNPSVIQTYPNLTKPVVISPAPTVISPAPVVNPAEEKIKPKESRRAKIKKRHRNNKEEKGIPANAITIKNSLAGEVAKARQHIKSSLECIDDIAAMAANNVSVDINNRLNTLEKEKSDLKLQVVELTALVKKLELRIGNLERTCESSPSKKTDDKPIPKPAKIDDDADDGVDLFGSDSEEEDTEAAKIKEQRLAEYAARKSKKPVLIAKSNIILDVKPWDDETDMKKMEAEVRNVKTDGLVWGASKLVPLAYGIHKLQISCVVEDEKVSIDWLQDTIQEDIEEFVQSVDIAAFNKV